jgi:uncharacterized protein with HEPN domain
MTDSQGIAEIIGDILSAAISAQQLILGITLAEFEQDQKTNFAVVRALEIQSLGLVFVG